MFDWATELPDLAKRAKLVAKNPVECARIFNLTVRAVVSELLGVPLDDEIKKTTLYETPGLFGKGYALFGVVEAQQRGALHFHALLKSAFASEILAKYAHDDKLKAQICKRIDKQFRASFNENINPADFSNTKGDPRVGMFESPSQADDIEGYADLINLVSNTHSHLLEEQKPRMV